MRRIVCLMFFLLSAVALTAQEKPRRGIWDILDGLGSDPTSTPTLDAIFSDIGDLLLSADPLKVNAIRARLAENDEETRSWEGLQAALNRGILVNVPLVLREREEIADPKAALEEEQRRVDELQRQQKLAVQRRGRLDAEVARKDGPRSRSATPQGSAALDLDLDVPAPPASEAGTGDRIRQAVDRASYAKALHLAGDHQGCLSAYALVPAAERTSEILYRMGRSHELLGQWSEAKVNYQAAATADPGGAWGSRAAFMLDIGKQKEQIHSLIQSGNNEEGR